ncbi:MAG: hypothetical protein ACE5HL_09605 [Terriglobia bacterium]
MLAASELRSGMTVRVEGELYKVLTAEYHAGGGLGSQPPPSRGLLFWLSAASVRASVLAAGAPVGSQNILGADPARGQLLCMILGAAGNSGAKSGHDKQGNLLDHTVSHFHFSQDTLRSGR